MLTEFIGSVELHSYSNGYSFKCTLIGCLQFVFEVDMYDRLFCSLHCFGYTLTLLALLYIRIRIQPQAIGILCYVRVSLFRMSLIFVTLKIANLFH